MHGLGIPTTRALALCGSDDPVYRETVETAAVLTRIAPSFLRFGHFEYFYYTGREAPFPACLRKMATAAFGCYTEAKSAAARNCSSAISAAKH